MSDDVNENGSVATLDEPRTEVIPGEFVQTSDEQLQPGQLGWVVSWKVPEEIPVDELRKALRESGLDPDLAVDLNNEHALRRGLREMKEHRVIRMLRREGADGQLVVFQFTHEYLDESEARYVKEAELTLDTKSGLVTADSPEIAAEAQALLYEHIRKRLTSDLTRLVQRIYDATKADLIPIREQGGAYFVPSQHDEIVRKTRQLLSTIGGRLRSFAVRLGSEETRESVAESMTEYFGDLVNEFRTKCDNLHEKTRVDVKERRVEQVAELRSKLELYQGLLSGMATSIHDEIDRAEQNMLEMLARSSADEGLPELDGEPEPAGNGTLFNEDPRAAAVAAATGLPV